MHAQGFQPENFSNLYRLEANNFWFVARNELICWLMQKYVAEARTFLEVGCGTGFVLSGIKQAFPELKVRGSEYFKEGLSEAAKRLDRECLEQMDARSIPYREEFDAIGIFDVLEHIEEDELVLQQINAALKPGGVAFITVPQHKWLWSDTDVQACHVRRYTRKELSDKLTRNGYIIRRMTSFVSSLLPVLAISRLKGLFPKKIVQKTVSGLDLPPLLNRIFLIALRGELWGIKHGCNLPCGGSLCAVAQKL